MTVASPDRRLRYGELDRDTVVAAVLRLARRSGIEAVTMRALAAELGTSSAAVYYHVPNKAALLDLVAESVLAAVRVPVDGSWDERLRDLYVDARRQLLGVAGIAGVLQTRPVAAAGRELDATSRRLLTEAGPPAATVRAGHSLLYTYLLGAVTLEHTVGRGSAATFATGLDLILAGLRESVRAA